MVTDRTINCRTINCWKNNPLGPFSLFFVLCSLFIVPCLSAQDTILPPGYFIDTESGEPRFMQRLVWRGGENTYRYEVILEKNEDGTFIPHFRDFTSSLFIVVSLSPGEYRFRIIPYDIFDIAGEGSQWSRIEVRHAFQPEPAAAETEIVTGENGEPLGLLLSLSGSNLDPDADLFLRHPDTSLSSLSVMNTDAAGNLNVFIDTTDLVPGEYNVIIINPGGLEAVLGGAVLSGFNEQLAQQLIINNQTLGLEQLAMSNEELKEGGEQLEINEQTFGLEELTEAEELVTWLEFLPEAESAEAETEIIAEGVEELETEAELTPDIELIPEIVEETELEHLGLKKTLIKLGVSWAPLIPIYGIEAGTEISLIGANMYFSTLFRIPADIYLGPELSIFWYDSLLTTGVNLTAIKMAASQRFAYGIRFGAGLPMFRFDPFEFAYDILFDYVIVNTGTFLSLSLAKHFLLEAGVDYLNIFYGEAASGCFRPWLGMALQF